MSFENVVIWIPVLHHILNGEIQPAVVKAINDICQLQQRRFGDDLCVCFGAVMDNLKILPQLDKRLVPNDPGFGSVKVRQRQRSGWIQPIPPLDKFLVGAGSQVLGGMKGHTLDRADRRWQLSRVVNPYRDRVGILVVITFLLVGATAFTPTTRPSSIP